MGLPASVRSGDSADTGKAPDAYTGLPIPTYPGASVVVNPQTASYAGVQADNGKIVEITNGSANTFTVDQLTAGTVIRVCQTGAGVTTITAGSGVTIRKPSGASLALTQWGSVALRWRSATEVVLEVLTV